MVSPFADSDALLLILGFPQNALFLMLSLFWAMPIEDLVENAELLKRVLEHYRYRLDNFMSHDEIKPLISGPMRRYLTFGQVKSLICEALVELTKDKNTANAKLPLYADLLRSAARQYAKDLERIREKTGQELPDTKQKELETEIEAVKTYLR